MGKSYDRAYFDRWYRKKGRVGSGADLDRKAALAVAAAELILGRTIRSALDVGCGEGRWFQALRKMRKGLRYLGIAPSLYAVSRFGRSRRIVSGSVATLGDLELPGPFDLVVCADVLHYVSDADLKKGLPALAHLTGSVAFLEVQSSADEFVGDREGWIGRAPTRYRRLFREAGLVPCGLHLYLGPEASESASSLERA